MRRLGASVVLGWLCCSGAGCSAKEGARPTDVWPPAGGEGGGSELTVVAGAAWDDDGQVDDGQVEGGQVEGGQVGDGQVGDGQVGDGQVEGGVCASSADCDDGVLCNGAESCQGGRCVAGSPIVCGVGRECSNDAIGACVYTDASPWLVYQADDDTPAVAEVYAVKRDLIGKMDPIQLNDQLEPGWQAHWSDNWSPDRSCLTFGVRMDEAPFTAAIDVVAFDASGPRFQRRIPGEYGHWSPSGAMLAVSGPRGFSLYERTSSGDVALVLQAQQDGVSNVHGVWSARGELVFAWTVIATQQAQFQRFARVGGAWVVQPLISNVALSRFRLSPTGNELVFEERPGVDSTKGALYSFDLVGGGPPRLVTAPGSYSYAWSPDGQRFLLVQNSDADRGRAFMATGRVHQGALAPIAPALEFRDARMSPDGKLVLFREPVAGDIEDVSVFDPSSGGAWPHDTIGRTGQRDGGPVFAANSDLGVLPVREDAAAPVELELFSLRGRRSDRFDSIPHDHSYQALQLSAKGEFLAYKKGVYQAYEGVYVDLRYHVGDRPKPVRLPGDGSVYGLELDPSGQALYYVLERANGARECFYLDISQQVAAAPVKVSRAGRVDYCRAQPAKP